MHELSICWSLLSEVERLADTVQTAYVRRIVVGVGPLSGVEPGLLSRAFEVAKAGTRAEMACLDFEQSDVSVRCADCGGSSVTLPNRLLCASCGSFRVRVTRGDELTLLSVEFDGVDSESLLEEAACAPERRMKERNRDVQRLRLCRS
ncbi:MAG: hydrogenase maturation nickel metallochaperone HypA [Bradyrhizobium sp.]|jgi:hydrogenase nickel incorporation protein HypA/HybF|uniref:hydrogenase maturation nickel metallochaperone HypA/HybF n=1 Tax=Bradyrhizobium sp. TaxID=376 RepID=UPI001A1D42B8|nr:hydrogenase maturation nickel metallochaperone HypA [Bradyrhizobium sp.]MBJ7402145.1 hydrogenase maturation nickel metallochaperone HypA [Bradyrhizobium sp.]